jgi:hypothetical protein
LKFHPVDQLRILQFHLSELFPDLPFLILQSSINGAHQLVRQLGHELSEDPQIVPVPDKSIPNPGFLLPPTLPLNRFFGRSQVGKFGMPIERVPHPSSLVVMWLWLLLLMMMLMIPTTTVGVVVVVVTSIHVVGKD